MKLTDTERMDKWFEEKEKERIGTYHDKLSAPFMGIYNIAPSHIKEFCECFSDIIQLYAIRCFVNDTGIWFFPEDLKDAEKY